MPGPLYLGVDPSSRSAGLALVYIVNQCEVQLVKPPKECRGPARLRYHRDALLEFVRGRILAGAAVEGPSLGSLSRQDDLGQVRGTYLLALEDMGVTAAVIAPTTLKKFGGGVGGADKARMLKTAREQWPGIEFVTDDLADAAWLAEFARALTEIPENLRRCQLEAIKGFRGKSHVTNRIKGAHILNV